MRRHQISSLWGKPLKLNDELLGGTWKLPQPITAAMAVQLPGEGSGLCHPLVAVVSFFGWGNRRTDWQSSSDLLLKLVLFHVCHGGLSSCVARSCNIIPSLKNFFFCGVGFEIILRIFFVLALIFVPIGYTFFGFFSASWNEIIPVVVLSCWFSSSKKCCFCKL